jgi:nucleoside-diphosphate-sugar epimerase
MSTTHFVLGKGPVGTATAGQLAGAGNDVVVLSRSGGSDLPATPGTGRIAHRAVDAADRDALVAATRGAEVIYNCLNPPHYHRWAEEWPPMAAAVLDAAESHGAVLVTASNLYGYGEVDGPIDSESPLQATHLNGRIRVAMWEEALRGHREGRVRVTEARAGDYFGAGVLDGGYLGSRAMPRILAGRGVRLLGDVDQPHAWGYVPDVAATLVALGTHERAWGRAWLVPGPSDSQRRMVEMLCDAAGVGRVSVGTIPWSMVRLAGIAVPAMRALTGLRQQVDRPFTLDASATEAVLGVHATPVRDAVAATVDWWRIDGLAAAA